MKRNAVLRLVTVGVMAGLLGTSVGCNGRLIGSHVASAFAGLLLGGITAAEHAEYRCYENGEPIDCADLPADLTS